MTAKNHDTLDGTERHFTVSSCRFKEINKKWRSVTSPNAKRALLKINAVIYFHMEA
jgi:hypothetical protein